MNALRHSKNWLSFVLILAIPWSFRPGASRCVGLCAVFSGRMAMSLWSTSGMIMALIRIKTTISAIQPVFHFTDDDAPCNAPCTDIALDGDDHIPLSLTDFVKIALDSGLLPVFFLFSLLSLHGRPFIRQPVIFRSTFHRSSTARSTQYRFTEFNPILLQPTR